MSNLFAALILSFSVPAFADLGSLDGLYRVDRSCSDGARPEDGLIDGTLYVSFGENKQTNIYASFLVPPTNTYCAERSSGEYETKEDGLRVRVTKREFLGECGQASQSQSQDTAEDAGEFIPLERTENGFKGVSGTDFEDGGSCKRGSHMKFEFVRLQSAPAPTSAEQPAPAPAPEQPAPEQPAPAPEQPAPEQPAPAPEHPAPEQPAPAPEQPAPAPEQPAPEQPAPAPAPEQPAPAPEQPAPAPEQPAPTEPVAQ